MSEKRVVIFVFDGFADWEAAYALAELRRSGKHTVAAAGLTASPVTSMGGLRILPDCGLGEVRQENVALFILPGGDAWESDSLTSLVAPWLRELAARQIPIAAICGATLAVARAGLLRGRHHTSTERAYLEKMVPDYAEAEHYVARWRWKAVAPAYRTNVRAALQQFVARCAARWRSAIGK